MFNIDEYLEKTFKSRLYADKCFNDFMTIRRRFRKFDRNTSDTHTILNMIVGLENTFDHEFIDYMLKTRFNIDDRKKYAACLKYIGKRKHEKIYCRRFYERLDAEIWKARRG